MKWFHLYEVSILLNSTIEHSTRCCYESPGNWTLVRHREQISPSTKGFAYLETRDGALQPNVRNFHNNAT